MQGLTSVKARVEVRPHAVFLDSLRACVQGEVWMEQICVWEQLEVKVPAPDKITNSRVSIWHRLTETNGVTHVKKHTEEPHSGSGMWVSSHCSGLHAFHGRHSPTIHCIVLFRHNKLPISWRHSQTGYMHNAVLWSSHFCHYSANFRSKQINELYVHDHNRIIIYKTVNNKLLLPSSLQHVFLVIVLVAKQQRNRKAYYTDKVCVQNWACHTSRRLVCSKLSLEYE